MANKRRIDMCQYVHRDTVEEFVKEGKYMNKSLEIL